MARVRARGGTGIGPAPGGTSEEEAPVPTKLSDTDRQARREADREKAAEAVQALTTSEGWQAWLALRRHFRTYSANNQFLIALQCQDATYVAGFRTWLQLGYAVRRGEQAIRIWMPMPPSKKALAEWEDAGAVPDEKPRTRFRLGPVFDRSQVDELPAPAEPVNLDPPIVRVEGSELRWAFRPLVELADDAGWVVVFEPGPEFRGGFCDFERKLLSINDRPVFSVNQQVKTLVHELSHMLLRIEREDDDLELTYTEEELVVESIAFTVCGSLGLDTSGYSIPYLASWAQRASMETIERAAGMVDRVAKRIEEHVIPSE
jgi:antirestriction protein ArdC